MLTRVTIPQLRYLNASTTQRYHDFCAAHNLSPRTLKVELQNEKIDATAHWLGDPDADIVILHCHGGAYTQPATSGTFLYLQHMIDTIHQHQHRTHRKFPKTAAALVLAYNLAPESPYPTQLKQASAILSHLLTATQHAPSTIFLSGDSSGGNLVLGLLSHLLHPHADIPAIPLSEPLAGAVLYSPLVSFREDWESVARNADVDMLPNCRIRWWGTVIHGLYDAEHEHELCGFVSGDAYTEPCLNDGEWWEGLHKVVDGALVTSGGDEVFVDSIRKVVRCLEKGWVSGGGTDDGVVLVETPGESHIGPIVDFMMAGGKVAEGSVSQVAVEEWYAARVMR